MSELGSRLRAAREVAGFSLAAMATRTHYSKPLLGHLETGRRSVSPEHVKAYSRALGVSVDVLVGPRHDPLRVAHEWLVSPTPTSAESATGRRVGASLADDLEHRVIELRHLDDTIGGQDLFPLVHRELTDALSVIRECSYTAGTGQRLLTTIGVLSQLAGWVASDAGRYVEAEQIYLSGVPAARAASNDVVAGQLLSSLSYQMANIGEPDDAALLARSAVAGIGEATPLVRALLLERVAWASARSQDADGTRSALDQVDDAFDRRSPGIEEPEWVYWMSRSEIDVMQGRCLIELNRPADAAPLLSRAIGGYDSSHVREMSLYQTWLAESYARVGQLDMAAETLDSARNSATGAGSVRLDHRIEVISRLIDSA